MTAISPVLFAMYMTGLALLAAGIAMVPAQAFFPRTKFAAPENEKRNFRILLVLVWSGAILHATADLIRFFSQ